MREKVWFWEWHKGGLVRLTIGRGEDICIGFTTRTDEGYCFENKHFFFDGERIFLEFTSGGRDCDGYIEHTWDGFASVDNLAINPALIAWKNGQDVYDDLVKLPEWEKSTSTVYDEEAQKAGY